MAIKFYYGSGSPFSWNVWLILEHKQLSYELKLISLQSGDLKKPDYLAINPHGKIPALIDDKFVIWESSVIVEYLEERYLQQPVLPSDPTERAVARRIAAEAYTYLYPVLRRLLEQTLFITDGGENPVDVELSIKDLSRELTYFENMLHGKYFVRKLSVADFTLYPLLALVKRLHEKRPQYHVADLLEPKLVSFMQSIEQLPYFSHTFPPHWKG